VSTIVDADTIIVMDAGRVVEQGTFDTLIATNGRFSAMWALQQAEA
jgi:ATP-binding cassette subfamily B protein